MSSEATHAIFSIPTIIWSGALAAIISLAGVILSNWSSRNRIREQLKHDSIEKHNERVAALRKDVYLGLVTQMANAQAHLGSLATKDPTSDDLAKPLQSVLSALGQTQLIGTEETADLASDLATAYGEALFKLIAAVSPLHETKTQINITGKLYDQQYVQAQRVIAEMTALNESGRPDPTRMAALQRSFKNYRKSYEGYSSERNSAWDKFNDLQSTFLQAVFEEIERISPIHTRLTCAIRREIGLPSNVAAQLSLLEVRRNRIASAASKLLAKINRRDHE